MKQGTCLLKPAHMGWRAAAATADGAIVFIALFWAAEKWGETLPDGSSELTGSVGAVAIVLAWAYLVVPEWLFGATVGKWMFSLRVVSLKGGPCSFRQSLKRNVARFVDSLFGYLVGFLVARSNPCRQRLGDLWAGTVVVESDVAHEILRDARR